MNNGEVTRRLMDNLEAHGFRAKMLSAERYNDAMEPVETYRQESQINADLYQRYLAKMEAGPQEIMEGARSILLVSFFQPPTRLSFNYDGRQWPVVVPPTYRWDDDQKLDDCVDRVLEPAGYRATRAVVPRKRLAVCSGLARYGRNNLVYMDGWGSFHRLLAFYTDLAVEEETWEPPKMMDRCQDCDICRKACPTGAIREDRFLVQADLCLTYHNEWDDPFADWIDPAWHNSLVGCMRCQQVCPENRTFIKNPVDGLAFSETETRLILETASLADLPDDTQEKLKQMGAAHTPNILPRNLGALLRLAGA